MSDIKVKQLLMITLNKKIILFFTLNVNVAIKYIKNLVFHPRRQTVSRVTGIIVVRRDVCSPFLSQKNIKEAKNGNVKCTTKTRFYVMY